MNDLVVQELHRYWSDRFNEMMARCIDQGSGDNITTLIPADVRREYMHDAHVKLPLLDASKVAALEESAMLIKRAVDDQEDWNGMRETLESGYRPSYYIYSGDEDDDTDYDDDAYNIWTACSFANQHTLAYNNQVVHTYTNMDELITKMAEIGPLEDWG